MGHPMRLLAAGKKALGEPFNNMEMWFVERQPYVPALHLGCGKASVHPSLSNLGPKPFRAKRTPRSPSPYCCMLFPHLI